MTQLTGPWPSLAQTSQMLRSGRASACDLVSTSLARIESLDPALGAFVVVAGEAAMAKAEEADRRISSGEARPLEGVPVSIKDNTQVAGLPTTRGSRAASTSPATVDSLVVSRLLAAGAIVVGKTALPEFGAIPVTESALLGATRNPWSLDLTPGGSSGGSAAAVAAGLVPVAHGNDGGGSLRIPASCCGLLGLKPSRGRISLSPDPGDAGAGLVTPGFLTRRTSDMALLLDLTAGPAAGDPYYAPEPRIPFTAAIATKGRRLRIGWTTEAPVAAAVDRECEAAVHLAAETVASLGHEVVRLEPDWTRDGLADDFRRVWAAGMLANVLALEHASSRPAPMEGHIRALVELGARVNSGELLLSQARLQAHARSVARLWEGCDVVMTPTLARLPLRVGELFQGADQDPLAPMLLADRFTPFTPLFNLTGQPAISVPVHWSGTIPVGVQLAGRLYEEGLLLQLSQELEMAVGWAERPLPAPLS